MRGSIAHTHDLPGDLQLFGKLQGQVASLPLVNSEQFAGGGLATVRGYLEAEGLGDDGVFASLELRSPQLATHIKGEGNDWRAYVFADGGVLTLHDPLPEQTSTFTLASVGVGTRFRFYHHFNGSLDVQRAAVGSHSNGMRSTHSSPFGSGRISNQPTTNMKTKSTLFLDLCAAALFLVFATGARRVEQRLDGSQKNRD